MKMVIEVKNLSKYYGYQPVLEGLDLDVMEGECFALMGPNGSGKSTLLRILATLVRPNGGQLRIGGFDVLREGASVRKIIGVVGHQSFLYPELSARENLFFYGRLFQVKDLARRVDDLLEVVGLLSREDDPVSCFSRGMSQRLAIARALLHRPQVLLLDEPYTGLDPEAGRVMDEIVLEFCQAGGCVVWTTHSPDRAATMATRIGRLVGGRVQEEAKPGWPQKSSA